MPLTSDLIPDEHLSLIINKTQNATEVLREPVRGPEHGPGHRDRLQALEDEDQGDRGEHPQEGSQLSCSER